MQDIIKINNLYKSYGDVKAVQDLSFKVKKGELFAFLGVNGAGKSTTISIICSALKKDSGSVIIDGNDIEKESEETKRARGVVFQNSVLDKSLTVLDNLRSRACVYGIYGKAFDERVEELCALLDFKPLLKRTVSKLSGGQKRKIDVARALIHKPSILILDEPTTGLDPQTRVMLWSVIENLRKSEQMTVFLTTHYMEEATDADYVVIIDSGKIVAEGTPIQLKNTYARDSITVYNASEDEIKTVGIPYEKVGNAFRFSVQNTQEATALIVKHPNVFKDYEVIKGKMDTVFLTVTGKNIQGGAQ